MNKEKIAESCRIFILNRIDEIQSFMDSGKSILDIFNYYQDIYDLRWKDYPTFGEYIRKSGLTFSKEALDVISKNRYNKKSKTMIDKSPEEKAQIYKKYKATMDNQSPEFKTDYIKRRELTKKLYTDEKKQHRVDTMNNTKRKNNSFNSSKPQEELKQHLISKYGIDNIICEYSDIRYPFNCDFYILSEDVFIELNQHFTHGSHPFNFSSAQDLEALNELKNKPQEYINKEGKLKSSLYSRYIDVWTRRDPNKLAIALKNNIKLILIYPHDIVYKYNTDLNIS